MTKTLYFLRHAKSNQDAGHDIKDHARPLAPRGIRAAAQIRQYLETHLINADRVYCSTAKRTRQTYDLIHEGLGNSSVSFRDALYMAGTDDLIAFIQSIPDALNTVMLIGHNPGFHDTSLNLIGRAGRGQAKALDKLRVKYPTGSLCALSFDVKSWKNVGAGLGTLTSFVRPRDLEKKA